MTAAPRLRHLLAIAVIAATTLALQVLLTRIFSAVLFYHFGFLTISLALLGVGGGAVLVYVRPRWFAGAPLPTWLARLSLLNAAATVIALAVIVRLDFTYTGVDAGFVFVLALACALCVVPLLAVGVAIALAVRDWTEQIGRLYFADLLGAGLGAIIVVPLLWIVSAPTLVVCLAVASCAAALLFADRDARTRAAALAAGAASVALVAVSASSGAFALQGEPGPEPELERWTPLSRIVAYLPGGAAGERGVVVYDRVVAEVLRFRRGGPYPDWRRTQEGPESIGYRLTPPTGSALVIGGGGGRDVHTALSEGYRDVDVIELNRGIRDAVDEDLGAYTGRPYSLPAVTTTIGDGRSVLARSEKRYSQINIGFTDTFSANSAQAFALTENNLYTREAAREYLQHLTPDGILKISRPLKHSGEEALRATVLALEALRAEGVSDPARHVAVLQGTYRAPFKTFIYGSVLIKRTPFNAVDLQRIRDLAPQRAERVLSLPGGPHRDAWAQLAAASSPSAFAAAYPLDVAAPTDDDPFFFSMKRLSDLEVASLGDTIGAPDPMIVLLVSFAILLVGCLALLALPLALVARTSRPPLASLGFFAAIGLGFLVLEIVLIQRFVLFLGFPTYALSVVLSSLLLATGTGALLTARRGLGDRRTLLRALAGACTAITLVAFGLLPLLEALIDLPFAARLAVTVAIIAPIGLLLGTAMPIGLVRLDALHPGAVPWAWAANGIASVLGSVVAIAVAINAGYRAATLIALACYLAALVHAWRGRWPGADLDEAPTGGPAAGSAPNPRALTPA